MGVGKEMKNYLTRYFLKIQFLRRTIENINTLSCGGKQPRAQQNVRRRDI